MAEFLRVAQGKTPGILEKVLCVRVSMVGVCLAHRSGALVGAP